MSKELSPKYNPAEVEACLLYTSILLGSLGLLLLSEL